MFENLYGSYKRPIKVPIKGYIKSFGIWIQWTSIVVRDMFNDIFLQFDEKNEKIVTQ